MLVGSSLFLLTILKVILMKTCHCIETVDKIVGGRKAADGEFPYQASLQKRSIYGYFHTCGAVLVAPEWLVTAAHCINSNTTSSYKIMMGSSSLEHVSSENFYSVKKIILKHGFNLLDFNNDIALIQISWAARNGEKPIKLADTPPEENSTVVTIGWGATSDGGSPSFDLQAAGVAIISRNVCLEFYPELTTSMICAGYEEGGIDACQGDSGGPLLQFRDGVAHLVGIVSWGIGCAEAGHPGVYTDVALFNTWIKHYVFP